MSRLEGFEEMKARLDELGKKTGGKIARTALRDGAKVLQAQLRNDSPDKSGQTRAAIKVRAGKRRRGRMSMMVAIARGAFKGGNMYAGFLNWGWLTGKRGSQNRHKIQGTEWLEKSWERGSEAAEVKVRSRVAELIEAEGT